MSESAILNGENLDASTSCADPRVEKQESEYITQGSGQDPNLLSSPTPQNVKTPGDVPKPSEISHNSSQATIEKLLNKSRKDLESMVIKYARSESENLQSKNKIDELEKKLKRSIKDNESLANRIRILTNDKNSITDTLNAKLAQLTVLEQRNNSLSNAQTVKLRELEEKCINLEETNDELLKQIDTYKNKEGELLDFSERLSMKQILLQTELDKALENTPDYKSQYELMREDYDQLSKQYKDCLSQLDELNTELKNEKDTCSQLRNEWADLSLKYRRRIEELENEIKVMRRKHQIAAKEIHKQMKLINETTCNNPKESKQQIIKS